MTPDGIQICAEEPRDYPAVHEVNVRAFESTNEADLVNQLRECVEPLISLVAVDTTLNTTVGHILFTPVTVEHSRDETASRLCMAIGPMAVGPTHQQRGIGSALVRHGLSVCAIRGVELVFVLGHPAFYPRFGFAPASSLGYRCQWDVPKDVFMALPLTRQDSKAPNALVRYHELFYTV